MKRLQQIEQFDEILKSESAVIFKHSTSCPISGNVLTEIRAGLGNGFPAPFYLVHVIEDRAVSNYIARHTGVTHESPQAMVLRRGEIVWHGSHFDITADRLKEALQGD